MSEITAFEVLRAGSLHEALLSGPIHWVEISGWFGLLAIFTVVVAVVLALTVSRRGAIAGLLACALLGLGCGVAATVAGARVAAEALNKLGAPTSRDLAAGGTASLESALLGGSVFLISLVLLLFAAARRRAKTVVV